MLIQQQQNGTKGSFFIAGPDGPLAEMTYTMPSPDKMIIDHTEVSEELRGKKAGHQLFLYAVEHARTSHIRIIPLCPFVKAEFKKNTAFNDVLS